VTATVSGHYGKVYEAMGHGALDAVDTPTLGPRGDLSGREAILSKLSTIAKLSGKSSTTLPLVPASPPPRRGAKGPPMVALGASTGGPNALAEVIAAFPKRFRAAVVVVQHVDAAFAPGLARWLRDKTGHSAEVAAAGAAPEPGRIDVAATNDHLRLTEQGRYAYTHEPAEVTFRPSVDVFFESASAFWPGGGVGAVLTGMGRDGADGLARLRRAGWETIAQDEATSVVWGMPRAAAQIGAARLVLPVGKIGPAAVQHVEKLIHAVEAKP
jgi:two-component system response regulator WspF